METTVKIQTNKTKKLSLINTIGLIASVVLILIAVFVMMGVKMNFLSDKESCFNFLNFFPFMLAPFIILYSIKSDISVVVQRIIVGIFSIMIISVLTLIITGSVSFFLGDYGHNLYANRIVSLIIIQLVVTFLYLILITVKKIKGKK